MGETEPERTEAICQTSHNDSMSRLKKDILFSDSDQVLHPLDYTISTLEMYLLIPAQELCSPHCTFKQQRFPLAGYSHHNRTHITTLHRHRSNTHQNGTASCPLHAASPLVCPKARPYPNTTLARLCM